MEQSLADRPPVLEGRVEQPGWGALVIVLTGLFVTTLDFFVVNVAIPSMQRDLRASDAAIQFVVAGYALALASGLITAGRMGDLYGRRRMFVLGLALFTASSAVCGLALHPGVLVAGRVAQGAAGALMTPQVLAILRTVYDGQRRATALAAYSATLGLGGVFGQVVGGILIQLDLLGLGWRLLFLINVPVGLVAVLLAKRLVPESLGEGRAGLDLRGAALVTIGLAALILPLIEGRQRGWPAWTWLLLIASPVLLTLFVRHQGRLGRRGGSPLIELSLFRQRAFAVGLVMTLVYYSAMASFFLTFALYLQLGRGLSALEAGLVAMLLGTGFFLGGAMAPRIAARWGRQVLAVGAIAQAGGYTMLGLTVLLFDTTVSTAYLIPGLMVAGFGMGTVMTPLMDTVLAGIRTTQAAAASGVLTTAVEVGGALGVAILGYIFFGALGGSGGPGSFSSAMTLSLLELIVVALAVSVLAQALPRRR